jgi:pyruvate formate lyase activating enzyme
VVFTGGCNLRCRYCHNPELCVTTEVPGCDLQSVLDFLDTRQGKLTGVVVSGGEPTLHAGLPAMLAAIRARGFAIKLDTNGMFPPVVKRIVDSGLVDYLAVDVKKEPGASSTWLCGTDDQGATALETLQHAAKCGVPHEARTTVVRSEHDLDGLTRMARAFLDHGVRAWRLQIVETGRVLDPLADLAPPAHSVLASAVATARNLGLDALVRRQPVNPNR